MAQTKARQIFVNLPVKDLKRSIAFFEGLGFAFDPKFTNEDAACMMVGENIFAMLLVERFFQTFTKKRICDTKQDVEVLVCLACESRAKVDELVRNAAASGGSIPRDSNDHGFMYEHAFEDPDGHVWELIYMEPDAGSGA